MQWIKTDFGSTDPDVHAVEAEDADLARNAVDRTNAKDKMTARSSKMIFKNTTDVIHLLWWTINEAWQFHENTHLFRV